VTLSLESLFQASESILDNTNIELNISVLLVFTVIGLVIILAILVSWTIYGDYFRRQVDYESLKKGKFSKGFKGSRLSKHTSGEL
jgi:uncharacterized protein HemY